MSARDDIAAHFTSDTLANQLLDAYRAEVLAKAGVEYEDCSVCGAAFSLGKSCGTCDFRARMAAEAGEKATAAATTATPDFFQVGRTYTRQNHGDTAEFQVRSIDTHPDGHPVAFGFYRRQPRTAWHAYSSDDYFDGWTDTTTGEPA